MGLLRLKSGRRLCIYSENPIYGNINTVLKLTKPCIGTDICFDFVKYEVLSLVVFLANACIGRTFKILNINT